MNGRRWPRLERIYVAGPTDTSRYGARCRLLHLGYTERDLEELARRRIRDMIEGDDHPMTEDLSPATTIPTKQDLQERLARELQSIATMERMLNDARERASGIEAALLNDPTVRMARSEGIPTRYGLLRRHEQVKGRAFPNKEEIDKHAGELPEELRPTRDHRVVVERLSRLPVSDQALVHGWAKQVDEDGKPLAELTEKAAYPTVSALRRAFGEDTSFVGHPAKVERVVLEVPGVDEDHPMLLSTDGVL